MEKRYPISVQSFPEIIGGGFVYVDKTQYVYDLANNYGNYIFLSRPRRFGKSLLASTFKAYFEGRQELFEHLAISRMEKEWVEHPVLYFDMSTAKYTSPEAVESELNGKLLKYEELYGRNPEITNLGQRLEYLIVSAAEKTRQQVVVIIDEYDAPLLNVVDKEDAMSQVRDIFSAFYTPLKALNDYIRFVFITGITKFSQMSIFSALNNLKNISMTPKFAGLCGITQDELEDVFGDELQAMASAMSISADELKARLRAYYDGYHFSSDMVDVYNPFSLMNAISDGHIDTYWFDSATPSSLVKMLNRYNPQLANIEGVKVKKHDFDAPFDETGNPLPVMYQSGYLTIRSYDADKDIYELGIPNQEVKTGLYNVLLPNYVNNGTVDDALAQIDSKNYLIPYFMDKREKVKVGIVFDKKKRTLKEWKVVR